MEQKEYVYTHDFCMGGRRVLLPLRDVPQRESSLSFICSLGFSDVPLYFIFIH